MINSTELPVVVGRRRIPRSLAEEGCCPVGVVGVWVYGVVRVVGFDVEVVVGNDGGWWVAVEIEVVVLVMVVGGAIVVVAVEVVVLVECIQMMVVVAEEVNGMMEVEARC